MGFLDIFKTSKQKIHDISEQYARYFFDEKFNEDIRTFTKKDFSDLCEEYLDTRQSPEILLRTVLSMKRENDIIAKSLNKFNDSFLNVYDKKITKVAILFKNKYITFQELEQNFEKDFDELAVEIQKYNDNLKYLNELTKSVETFNIFAKSTKKIDLILPDLEITLGNFNNHNIGKNYENINKYMEMEEGLRSFIDNKYYLPYSEKFAVFKNKWISLYEHLSYETFGSEMYDEFKNEQNLFSNLIYISGEIKDYQDEIRERLNDFFARLKVNKILADMFNNQLIEFDDKYKHLGKMYVEQRIEFEELKKEYISVNKSIIDLNSKYVSLLSPIKNTTNMLGITDDKEVQDICDYYVYSLSKSIEKEMNAYGSSKNISEEEVNDFIRLIEEKLYKLTQDQITAINSSIELLNSNYTASCLIQGDVSAGKTIVTAALMFILAIKKMKSVYIVPRRVLRLQHLKTLRDYNELFGLGLNIYDASEDFDIEKADIVLNGYSFGDKRFSEVDFDLGVVDEIQLFGVDQRNAVQRKYPNIDMFYTTATPHPRTKLISLIGNMDVIEIRELPPGRKPKQTEAFFSFEEKHHNKVIEEVKKGHLVFVVCPLVNKVGSNDFESLPTAYRKYKELFPELKVDILRADYTDDKKEEIIEAAINGEIDILVATKSIEVGIDIPRASVIFIHYPYIMKVGWGVSQLHQLRGRIGRKNQDSFCYIETPSVFEENSPIGSVLKTQDVFELTKNDFNWRGFEKIIGTKQSGKSGGKVDQEKRIKAYELIAKNTPKLTASLDYEFVKKIESYLSKEKIENLN